MQERVERERMGKGVTMIYKVHVHNIRVRGADYTWKGVTHKVCKMSIYSMVCVYRRLTLQQSQRSVHFEDKEEDIDTDEEEDELLEGMQSHTDRVNAWSW